MISWVKELFGVEKPVIAMAHLPALPGTPRYDEKMGIHGIVDKVGPEVQYLLDGGVDAIMFSNEDDRPYVFRAEPAQIAAMTRIVTELRPKGIPFGVDYMWDPVASLCIAAATGASFIREVLTGAYESDMGLWSPDVAQVMRLRRNIYADHVRIFFNIVPEFCGSLGPRTVAERARSVVFSSLADGLLVSGLTAGASVDVSLLEQAKAAVGDEAPVFLNTGAKAHTIQQYLKVADGVIVASSLKVDGITWNPVDPARVRQFMDKVREFRRATAGQ